MKVFHKKDIGFIGVPKHGKLKLDFIVPYKFDIDSPTAWDDEGNVIERSGKTLIYCRFHSSKGIAKKSMEELLKTQGVHARAFEYDGTDKTEDELIDWLFTTDNLKPNNGMEINIKSAKLQK